MNILFQFILPLWLFNQGPCCNTLNMSDKLSITNRTSLTEQIVDPCKLYGSVYVEQNLSFAKYKVYIENDEAFCQLRVFEQPSYAFADRPGNWYFTKNRNDALFTIAFTDVKAFADFSIYYTQFQSLAGCPGKP